MYTNRIQYLQKINKQNICTDEVEGVGVTYVNNIMSSAAVTVCSTVPIILT